MILQYSNPRDFLTIDRDPASTVSAKSSGFGFVSYFDIRISDSRDKDMKSNSTKLRQLFKEPLVHFLLIGVALFLINAWKGNPASLSGKQDGIATARVMVGQDDINQMVELFSKTWQRPPTEAERKGLIEDFIRNEVLYREAVAIGLDRDDEVLRRRLRQKMEFIYENISSLAEPTEQDLKAFMNSNREKYLTDPKTAFRQVYISAYKRGVRAEVDAGQILAQLAAGADPDSVGDSTMLPSEVPLSPLWQINKQFGEEFGRNLFEIKPGRWAGPIGSGFGLHLVFVRERMGGSMPALNEVREAVRRDWMTQKQKELKDAAYEKILKRYDVVVERPKANAASSAPTSARKAIVQ